MEKFQGPTNNQCFGGNLDVDEEQCHGNTGFNFSYGAPYFNLEGESFTIQEQQQQQQQQQQEDSASQQQTSLSISVPIVSLEDKMPFLEMLKSVDSPYYSDPAAPVNPHFRMLLKLQHQQERQIPHFSGSSSSDQSSMDYYYSHQMEAPQPVAIEPQNCVTATTTTTKAESLANSTVKSEDNKEKEEQEHMEQLEQDHAQDYYLSLHLESNNNENNNMDNGELGGEPPNYSSPECLNSRQTVSSPTTTCCLAETESISPCGTPSKTKSAGKPAPPAARIVTCTNTTTTSGGGHEREKKKRKRTRPNKNREEVESQRMTHIAVERNRRRQMNDHLNALRSLMPASFVQRGDQASIIGGAIDFVKELEQLLQSLEAKKRMRTSSEDEDENVEIKGHKARRRRHRDCGEHPELAPFLGFFSSPQYTSYSTSLFLKNDAEEEDEKEEDEEVINEDEMRMVSCKNTNRGGSNSSSSNEHEYCSLSLLSPSSWLGVDIEVAVVQTHVNLKILGPRKPGQLVRAIAALEQDLRLTILHLNVTSSQLSVLYSFNLKIEDDCKLGSSADEIATAVYQIFSGINTQLHLLS